MFTFLGFKQADDSEAYLSFSHLSENGLELPKHDRIFDFLRKIGWKIAQKTSEISKNRLEFPKNDRKKSGYPKNDRQAFFRVK